MIAYLRGRVESRGEGWVVLEVQGTGYLIYCSNYTLARLPGLGKTIHLYISTEISNLYGFTELVEKECFCLLLTVRGINAKVALHILSVLTAQQLARSMIEQDKDILTRAIGVGPKLAVRLSSELRDKIIRLLISHKELFPMSQNVSDAISALVNLGYPNFEATNLVIQAKSVLTNETKSQVQYDNIDPDISMLVHMALKLRKKY